MSKLWLCGMFRGDKTTLEKSLSHIIDYFDGLIAVVDDRITSDSLQWLESIKKDGKIIVKKWVNRHDHTSNEVLFAGGMEEDDYFVWIDETDILNLNFVKDLRESVSYWKKNGVDCVYLDRPFILRFTSSLTFSGNPHWGIGGILGKVVELEKINGYKKETYLKNGRDFFKSAFMNPAKYWFEYPNLSNQTQLLYGQFGAQVYNYHENLRIKFREFCRRQLGIPLTLQGLITYLCENVGRYPKFVEDVIDLEPNVKDMFRLFVLNQPYQELVTKRFDWSYYLWKETGDILQKDSDYVSQWNTYKKQIGLPTEP